MKCGVEGAGGTGRFPRKVIRAERGVLRGGSWGTPGFPHATGAERREAA